MTDEQLEEAVESYVREHHRRKPLSTHYRDEEAHQ